MFDGQHIFDRVSVSYLWFIVVLDDMQLFYRVRTLI